MTPPIDILSIAAARSAHARRLVVLSQAMQASPTAECEYLYWSTVMQQASADVSKAMALAHELGEMQDRIDAA